MKKIKIFPAPHLEVRIHVSEQMEADLRRCRENKTDETLCAGCSWSDVDWMDTGFCDLPEVIDMVLKGGECNGKTNM